MHPSSSFQDRVQGSLVLTFDLNNNFRYLVKSILEC